MRETRLGGRWYSQAAEPFEAQLERAFEVLDLSYDPWEVARAGLGGALAMQTARRFGRRRWSRYTRRWRRATHAAVTALEAYNLRMQTGGPSPTLEERADMLAIDLDWARRLWGLVLEHDSEAVAAAVDRLVGVRGAFGDLTIPETVLFLRVAVSAGAVIGDVPSRALRALEEYATWVGLAWEASRDRLGPEGWNGALAVIGLSLPWPEDPEGVARDRAAVCFDRRISRDRTAVLRALVEEPFVEPRADRRHVTEWAPVHVPDLGDFLPAHHPAGAWGEFAATWSEAVEQAMATMVRSDSDALSGAAKYLQAQGGKRVRALLVLAAGAACGGSPEGLLRLAAAIEWIHQGSLVLDDMVDEAELRRGVMPLHRVTTPEFATGVAVYVFSRVVQFAPVLEDAARHHLVRGAMTVAEGEHLELRNTGVPELSTTTYYRIIEAKTARLFSMAAINAAISVTAAPEVAAALGRFGRELGLAFQLEDDLLDYVGDAATFGKEPGTDLRASKATLPYLLLRDALDGAGRRRLEAALGSPDALDWVLGQMRRHRIEARCRERIAEHTQRALGALESVEDERGRELLASLARELADRNS